MKTNQKPGFIAGSLETRAGMVPLVTSHWSFRDYLGTWKVRSSFGRDAYKVNPGLYAIGSPGPESDVFVSANYKLSFDVLRRGLEGISGWILVLDTRGVNVWCAAGKGTFGTRELANRIQSSELEKVVQHRRLIVPQLGATGVSAHEVKAISGFSVRYGPVKATDIRQFIADGYKTSGNMRTVTFTLKERAKLIPNDFVYGKYYLLSALAVVVVLSGLYPWGYSLAKTADEGIRAGLNVLAGYAAGIIVAPLLLPLIPFRSFSLKGFVTGILAVILLSVFRLTGTSITEMISWFFMITAVSSFVMMNFTGSSTYTSLSGVRKEMKIAIPFQISFASAGLIIFLISNFTSK